MKFGIIGIGKMGSALLKGILNSSILPEEDICIYDLSQDNTARLLKEYPRLNLCPSAIRLAEQCDAILLAVKPNGILDLLTELTSATDHSPLFISLAAGIDLKNMEKAAKQGTRIIRMMPNTPVLVGQGAISYAPGTHATEDDCRIFNQLLSPSGTIEQVPESQINAITAIAGCGPAYMYVILDALCDAGVALGLPRDRAKRFAIQTMLGSATLAQQTDRHLMALRDDVSSPGGSTIAALNALDEEGLRRALIRAVKAADQRNGELNQSK